MTGQVNRAALTSFSSPSVESKFLRGTEGEVRGFKMGNTLGEVK